MTKKKGASAPTFIGLEGITVNVILDSINPRGQRVTTLHLRYPRMVHSELMTHRVFSRNGRSSRAVPVTTLSKEDVYLPIMKYNKSGMQPAEVLTKADQARAQKIWKDIAQFIQEKTEELNSIGAGVHKQWTNRLLEPQGWIDTLVTSTEWNNFLHLRLDSDAQDEIRDLAQKIQTALQESTPNKLKDGEWHLPYIIDKDYEDVRSLQREIAKTRETRSTQTDVFLYRTLCKISAARCARISYKPFTGEGNIESELERYERLAGSSPVHASPLEHQCMSDSGRTAPHFWGNLNGFVQFRKTISNEYVNG